MTKGSQATDDKHFSMSAEVVAELTDRHTEAKQFIRDYLGGIEFTEGKQRYCLWIEDSDAVCAIEIPQIEARVNAVQEFRASRNKAATRNLADQPWRFAERRFRKGTTLFVPKVTTKERDYLPMGFVESDTIVSDQAFAVYDAEAWLFALLTSQVHMAWMRAVCGCFKDDPRYSNTIVYNNFPVPPLSTKAKGDLSEAALRVLDVREYHSEKTLAELCDPDLMPDNLRLAHSHLDALVDSIYRKSGFSGDEERLSHLFGLYSQMVEAEEASK